MVAAALAFGVVGCSNVGTNPVTEAANTPVNMQDPAKAVFALKSAYAGILTVAVAYNKRPRCGTPNAGPLCSDANVIAQIREADNVAFAAINSAEKAVRGLGANTTAIKAAVAAAQAAVDAFKAVTPAS
jgi:hypothetical protein